MPIPLGILAVAGASAPAEPFALISSTVLGSNATTISFSGIPQTYNHLQLRCLFRNSAAQFQVEPWMQFNGSATGYAKHELSGVQSTVAGSNPQSAQTRINLPGANAANDTANVFSFYVIDILDYKDTSKVKTVKSWTGASGATSQGIWLHSGLWENTSAISSILFDFDNGDFLANSKISLYGRG